MSRRTRTKSHTVKRNVLYISLYRFLPNLFLVSHIEIRGIKFKTYIVVKYFSIDFYDTSSKNVYGLDYPNQ